MGVKVNIQNKSFGRKLIFKDFSYCFENTGLYVIKAKSGRGKTTLLRIIAGLDNDFQGSIEGINKDRISMHFQEYRLFDTLNAHENVYILSYANPTAEQKESAKQAIIDLGFTQEETMLYPKELSGGMKMRVSIARALQKDADVYLFDEPTKELDSEAKIKVASLICEKAKQKLVIIVTHDELGNLLEIKETIQL